MLTKTKQTEKRKEKGSGFGMINVILFVFLALVVFFNFNTPTDQMTDRQMKGIEKAISTNLSPTDKRLIMETLIDHNFSVDKLIVEQSFEFPSLQYVRMKMDVLRFIMNYNDCFNDSDIDHICIIWRMLNGLNPHTKNVTLRNLKSKWQDQLDNLITFQIGCQPGFDIEEHCK